MTFVKLFLTFLALCSFASCASSMKYNKDESGAELWAQNCMRCHNSRGIDNYTDQQWQTISDHMRSVSKIPGNQAKKITQFLKDSNIPETSMPTVIANKSQADPNYKPNVDNGGVLFKNNCSACHGDLGKGDGVAATALNPRPRDLTEKNFSKNHTDNHLFEAIKNGGSSEHKSALMPPFKETLSDSEIKDIVSYIRKLEK